ncbi:hypothetical protein CPB85DRAFT_1432066 [Mucidula mucida]|nr:hypothetical protein CPB85DRAFT_1432066 [Mucidula mucida]
MPQKVRVPVFVWRLKRSLKSLSLGLYALIVGEDAESILKRSNSLAPRGNAKPPAKASPTTNTGAANASSQSKASAGGNTTGKSGAKTNPGTNSTEGPSAPPTYGVERIRDTIFI